MAAEGWTGSEFGHVVVRTGVVGVEGTPVGGEGMVVRIGEVTRDMAGEDRVLLDRPQGP